MLKIRPEPSILGGVLMDNRGNCGDAASEGFLKAVALFNSGEWLQSHELLEEFWADQRGELRDFLQGLIQVGAALYHWRNGNFGGSVRLLERAAEYLRRARPVCLGVDAAAFTLATDRLRQELQILGPGRMADLDPALIPWLRLVEVS